MLCLVASLILHVFNDIEIGGGLKLFHAPAAAAFILSFVLGSKKDRIHTLAIFFIIWSLLGALTSPWDGSFMRAVTLVIIIGSVIGVRSISDKDKLLSWINLALPLPLLALTRHYFTDVWYRYQGFYEDPNYMCTTLIVFLYLILLEFVVVKNKYIKLALISEILIILFLVSTTISRTGLVCTGMVLVLSFWNFFKKNKVQTFLIAIIAIGSVLYSKPELVDSAISGYVLREDNSDNINSATSLRREISMRGITFVLTHPLYTLQGIGVGATAHHEKIEGFIAHSAHGDHNTITSSMTEQGVVGFVVFLMLLWNILKNQWYRPKGDIRRNISLVVFGSIFLFSLSINDMLYLPYWFLMIYLSKREI